MELGRHLTASGTCCQAFDLSSIPGTHVEEGEHRFPQTIPWPTHVHPHTHREKDGGD